MPSPEGKPIAPRKRNRKRKRRVASPTSSSSSSGSESEVETTRTLPFKPPVKELPSSESSPESSSDSDSEGEVVPATTRSSGSKDGVTTKLVHPRRASPSPTPPPAKLPSFIPSSGTTENNDAQQEQAMKEKFRKFWMASIADGFKEDLEEIRKEPNFGAARLSLLIDSLASGAGVFATSSRSNDDIDEVGIILE